MKADLSRNTFRQENHYRDVLKQQGRVDVDANWNEQQAINTYRSETTATDVIGPCGAPLHEAGFHIVTGIEQLTETEKRLPANLVTLEPLAPGDFIISAGRLYVDGILCENELLFSFMGTRPDSPSRPVNPLDALKAKQTEFGIVYLHVWLRHITALDDPLIRETALGGPDTATRAKVVWQVKVLPVSAVANPNRRLEELLGQEKRLQEEIKTIVEKLAGGIDISPESLAQLLRLRSELERVNKEIQRLSAGPQNCTTSFPEWDSLIQASTGMLSARAREATPTDNLCQLPPSAGYQRLENQLYRVEIHNGSDAGPTTFKWSRDNGSVVTSIETTTGHDVIVDNVGLDDVLGFSPGQWVEISDDEQELNGVPGDLIQIENVSPGNRTITMKTTPRAVDRKLHPKLRRWDMPGLTANANGVTVNGDWQPLEDGIEVRFKGTNKTGDYWLIPARTATGQVEWPPFDLTLDPLPQPPLGIQHHFCRLALVELADGQLKVTADCRDIFPPLTEISASARAAHVTSINWSNDGSLPLDRSFFLETGLQVTLDSSPDSTSVGSSSVVVTMEVPLIAINGPARTDQSQVSLILEGVIKVAGLIIEWKPTSAAFEQMLEVMNLQGVEFVRVRVMLKGFAIWTDQVDSRIHLDGQALGIPGKPANANQRPRTDLKFPSGIDASASDFESWFFLAPPPPPPPKLVSLSLKPEVILSDSQQRESLGRVVIDGLAPAGGTVIALKSSLGPGIAELPTPPTVTVPGGSNSATFPILCKNTAAIVTISATLDAVTKKAKLTIEASVA